MSMKGWKEGREEDIQTDRQTKGTGRTEEIEDRGEQERRYRHRIYIGNILNFSATSKL